MRQLHDHQHWGLGSFKPLTLMAENTQAVLLCGLGAGNDRATCV